MRDPNQQFIFNDEEISVIKNTFAENEPLLYAVRKVFLQFPTTEAERNLIKLSITPQVVHILRKRILPEISDEFPITQLPSILTTLTEQMKVNSTKDMAALFAAKDIEIRYLEQQFAELEDVFVEHERKIVLTRLGKITDNTEETYINLTAYLFLLGYIDPMLTFIRSIAGSSKETVEQAKKRLDRNSSK